MASSPAPVRTVQDVKIKGVSSWFYIIAGFQAVAAYLVWNAYGNEAGAAAFALAAFDVVVGALFVVLGYFAGKRQPWAFVAGLALYALRAVVQLFQLFNPVTLVIRAFLMFRIFQGLQACLAANNADKAMTLMNHRRLVMPQATVMQDQPAATPPPAWTPSRPIAQPSSSE